MMIEFTEFPKIARLMREIVVTEKIDGTNAQIYISDPDVNGEVEFVVGSKNRHITADNDHHGFAAWAELNKQELLKLGPGLHFGEWWGKDVGRKYNIDENRFSLFNTGRWTKERPACCHVVPILYQGMFDTGKIKEAIESLAANGSVAAPGFDRPEGIVVFHVAANICFKQTIGNDGHKGNKK